MTDDRYDHNSAVEHISQQTGISQRQVDLTIRSFFGMSGIRFFFSLLRKIKLKGFGEWSHTIATTTTTKNAVFKKTVTAKNSDKVIAKKSLRHAWEPVGDRRDTHRCTKCGIVRTSNMATGRVYTATDGTVTKYDVPKCVK